MTQTISIFPLGFLRAAQRLSAFKDKQLVKTMRIENLLPTQINSNEYVQNYHYETFIQYRFKEVVPIFANAVAQFSNLQELKLIIKAPMLEKDGFDYLATVINQKLVQLKKIEVYALAENKETNEANNWTTKLRNNVECKCF